MSQHGNQRVGVFIDVQNMYYSAKQLYHAKVNYTNILKTAVAGRKLIRAIAYVIKADVRDEKDFFEALEKIGFEVRAKDLQVFFGGAKKGDWDVGIAMDIMRLASKLDVIVLVSGDGDFKDLLEHVKALGCRAEIIAFGKTASSRLKNETDMFIDMEKDKRKYLIVDDRRKFSKPRPSMSSVSSSANNNIEPKKVVSSPKPFMHSSSFRPQNRPNYNSSFRSDNQVSMLQRINMEQPVEGKKQELKKTIEKKKEPETEEKNKTQSKSLQKKEQTNEDTKQEKESKPTEEKPKAFKKKSLIKKIVSKVKKKK
ncbi:NYN domain-containing protein [Candidatus Woesearchaeota archaeon]|nr:NYN domain-containing protein [Candidatus Woesearchaeota archaeon]